MKILSMLLLIAMSSCRAYVIEPGVKLPKTVTYVADADIEPEFVAAFELWNAAVDHYFTLTRVEPSEPHVMTIADNPFLPSPYFGWTDLGINRIEILDPLPSGNEIETVLLHEIGHCMGLNHSPELQSVMYFIAIPGRPAYLFPDDIDGVRSIYVNAIAEVPSFEISSRGRGAKRLFTARYPVTWDFGDGTTAVGTRVVHRYTTRGYYQVFASYEGAIAATAVIIDKGVK